MVSGYAYKYIYIYAHERSMVFPALIFMKLTSAEQCYVQICHTKFYPNWMVNMRNMDRNSFMCKHEEWLLQPQF
jgi:hypothetical protein